MRRGSKLMVALTVVLVILLAIAAYGAYITSPSVILNNSSADSTSDDGTLAGSANPLTETTNPVESQYAEDAENGSAEKSETTENADTSGTSEDLDGVFGAKNMTMSADTTDDLAVGLVDDTADSDSTQALTGNVIEDTDSAENADSDEDAMFSNRDLTQEADLTDAQTITLVSGEDSYISAEGTYIVSGQASESTIIIDAAEAKVQLVLDGVDITNTDSPAIYVKNADKVFVTTTADSDNILTVTGAFATDGEYNLDGVIYSRDDLTLNGQGSITISSTANGVVSKDDMKITGGSYTVTSIEDAFEANEDIKICGGTFDIDSSKDGFNAGNDEDNSAGTIYISGGTFTIDALRQGLQSTATVTVDGGDLTISAAEGIESTYITINDGNINISASDDGMNATSLSTYYDVMIEVNGGNITMVIGSGDTDGFDANGSIVINGGYVDVTASSAFDYDYTGTLNGGTVIVNGSEVTELTSSMGGHGGGGHGGRGMW